MFRARRDIAHLALKHRLPTSFAFREYADAGGLVAYGVNFANMFRRVWSLGSAGVEVPLKVMRNAKKVELTVRSGDRAGFQRKGTLQ